MAVIPAAVTDDARKYLPQMLGGLITFNAIDLFKIGEGGWIDPGGGKQARTPVGSLRRVDNSIQDIDAIVDATRAAPDQRYAAAERASFSKALAVTDMSWVSPTTLEIRCLLDTTEFNDDGFGNSPELWEIGVFGDHPTAGGEKLMWGYGTFPLQTKTASGPLLNIMRLVF
jgi:hypothetical protein